MSDQYELDISSVSSLIHGWQGGAEAAGQISQQLATIHNQLESSVPSALVEGLLGQVPLIKCFAKLAAAAEAAATVAAGLTQDTSTLEQNLTAYLKAEQEVEAQLKAVQAKQQAAEQQAAEQAKRKASGGGTHASGGGSSPDGSGGGGGGGSGGGGGNGGGNHDSTSGAGSGNSTGGGNAQPPGPAQYANQDQVEQWINQAFQVLEANGVPAGELDEAGVLLIIENESSGNPNAINNWDSNAKAGDPSRGLMQTIGTTFDAFKLPGYDDIYNPVDNIIAGVRYAISRYGSIQNVPGVKSVDSGGSYVGY